LNLEKTERSQRGHHCKVWNICSGRGEERIGRPAAERIGVVGS